MRIVVDLDGTICELRKRSQSYSNVSPNPLSLKKIKQLKKDGHYIIIQTARRMKTHSGNQGSIMADIGLDTLKWLKKHRIPFDEIYFGKPYADVYIDDLGFRFNSWNNINTIDFNEKIINILVPMAGIGSRFKKARYELPKPLIEVKGKKLIEWAMDSFNNFSSSFTYQYIFVVLESHVNDYQLDKVLYDLYGTKIKIIKISEVTNGQAQTCLSAKQLVNNFNKLIIYNCDTLTISNPLELIEKEDPDGLLPCFESTDPRYSFAKVDQQGYVSEVREKTAISNLASTGMYYFKRGLDFVEAAEHMIDQNMNEKGEFFVAPTYNYLLQSGKKIKTLMVDEYWVFGTPEELDNFNENYGV